MFEQYPEIMTVREACQALRVGYNVMYNLLSSGAIKAMKCGRTWKIPRKSLYIFITNNRERL